MSEQQLPDLEIGLGGLTRLIRSSVRVTLAVALVLVLAGLVVVLTTGPAPALRTLGAWLGVA